MGVLPPGCQNATLEPARAALFRAPARLRKYAPADGASVRPSRAIPEILSLPAVLP